MIKDMKEDKTNSNKKKSVTKDEKIEISLEKGFIPYCKRFMNTMKGAYTDMFTL